ncbi:endonuclease/exonuclease/phosphatase family protein [Psychrosphaera ytuae]|nr:endonuclease/exonuclease/phosphatase family protein [Psychrosphaera ytuae]
MQLNSKRLKMITIGLLLGLGGSSVASAEEQTRMTDVTPKSAANQVRVATFNVSMEADNYKSDNQKVTSREPAAALVAALQSGQHPQIKNIAEIIQRVQPDVILLNEFDYISDPDLGINLFQKDYLGVSQNGQTPIQYPHVYLTPVNTGVKTGLGEQPNQSQKVRLSHYGFGKYPGQYGMVLLSKFPIDTENTRTFQTFLWKDMPNNLMPVETDGTSWYRPNEVEIMRLSSKSHWDVPVKICDTTLHVLASHPTPPVFDGKEDRNGRRNHDELRFWKDYINAKPDSYHFDDKGKKGGMSSADAKFVIVGDLNASAVEGDAYPGAMEQLLSHPKINNYPAPLSVGGLENKPKTRNNSDFAATHTAGWGMRADYVLPSANLDVANSGVYWPSSNSDQARLVKGRSASSDHRLVWADLVFPKDISCKSQE